MSQRPLFEEPSFAELWRFYDAEYLSQQRSGTSATRRSMGRAALEHFEKLQISHPKSKEWMEYLNGRVVAGTLMRSTANQHRKCFSHCYDFARESGDGERNTWRLLNNPFKQNRVPKFAEPTPRYRAWEEPLILFPRLLEAAPDPLARLLFSVMREHGLRIEETLALEGTSFNLDKLTLRIEYGRSMEGMALGPLKSEMSRATLPLHPDTAQLFSDAMQWRMAQDRKSVV